MVFSIVNHEIINNRKVSSLFYAFFEFSNRYHVFIFGFIKFKLTNFVDYTIIDFKNGYNKHEQR